MLYQREQRKQKVQTGGGGIYQVETTTIETLKFSTNLYELRDFLVSWTLSDVHLWYQKIFRAAVSSFETRKKLPEDD